MLDLYRQRMTSGQGMFAQAAGEVGRTFTQRGTAAQQGLVSAGLANSTVMPTVMAGIDRARADALASVAQRSAAYQAGMQADLAGAIERREDEYPSLQMMLQLAHAVLGSSDLALLGAPDLELG